MFNHTCKKPEMFMTRGACMLCLAVSINVCSCVSDNDKIQGTGGAAASVGGAPGGGQGNGGGSNSGGNPADSSLVTDGQPGLVETLYSFDTSTEGFGFNDYVQQAPYTNLFAPGDAGTSGGGVKIEHSTRDCDAASAKPGSLKITATFGEWYDMLSVEVLGPKDAGGNPIDLSHKILNAKFYLEKGLSPSQDAPGGFNFYLKTGSTWAWGSNKVWTNFTPYNEWIDLSFDTTAPETGDLSPDFDPTQPVQLGFELMSGGGAGGTFGAPLETIIYIDNITMRNKT